MKRLLVSLHSLLAIALLALCGFGGAQGLPKRTMTTDELLKFFSIGNLSANPYGANSTANPYSPAGSPYSPQSINNPYGTYGSPYSPQSVKNPYATDAPRLFDSQGNYHGKLSINKYDPDSISNPYGRFGSKYSSESINNPYGAGSIYNPESPRNPYGTGLKIVPGVGSSADHRPPIKSDGRLNTGGTSAGIAEIIRNFGNSEAENALRRGDIYSNMADSLGRIPGDVLKMMNTQEERKYMKEMLRMQEEMLQIELRQQKARDERYKRDPKLRTLSNAELLSVGSVEALTEFVSRVGK